MADNTHIQIAAGIPIEIPMKLTPEEIVDAIMAPIEPDLTHAQLPLLKEKYKNETLEEKRARGRRYQKAFREYDRSYAEFLFALEEKVRSITLNAFRDVEISVREKESAELGNIESTLSSLD